MSFLFVFLAAFHNLAAIDLYDIHGIKVLSVSSQTFADGEHIMPIKSEDLSAGVYILSVKTKSTELGLVLIEK